MSAWIEIYLPDELKEEFDVALYMSAWIEMDKVVFRDIEIRSHST